MEQLAGQHEFTNHITITQQSIGGSLASNYPPLQLPGVDAYPKSLSAFSSLQRPDAPYARCG